MKENRSTRSCCGRCRRQLLLKRAGTLRQAAAAESEASLLRAAVWLDERARQGDPALVLEAALHYLVLAEHPEVRAQPGLAGRYLERAERWLSRVRADTALPAPSDAHPDRVRLDG